MAVPKALTSSPRKPGEKTVIALNNDDITFTEIRNLSVERLGAFMQEKAIHIREKYTNFREKKDATIAEIHDFVKKIPKLTKDFKSLHQHIHIAELIKQHTDSREFRDRWQWERGMLEGESYLDGIEELFFADTDRTQLFSILRLICIQSITSGGIRASRYDSIRRTISHLYGYQHLFTLNNFERAGTGSCFCYKRRYNIRVFCGRSYQKKG